MVVDRLTRETHPLTDGSANDNSPAWSPRGDRIAFTSERDSVADYDIFSIGPDGTGLRRLTSAAGNDSHPAWSPDGQWIVFTSARGGFKDEAPLHPYNPQPYGEICVMRADGSDLRVLTDNQFEDGTPTWVPR
jgi:Tol biopolymer transport system component